MKWSCTSVLRLFSPMRNSVQADVVAIMSQDFILLTGVPSVADDLALGEEKPRWETDLKSTSLGKIEVLGHGFAQAVSGSAEDFL